MFAGKACWDCLIACLLLSVSGCKAAGFAYSANDVSWLGDGVLVTFPAPTAMLDGFMSVCKEEDCCVARAHPVGLLGDGLSFGILRLPVALARAADFS